MSIRRVGDSPAQHAETLKAVLLLTGFFCVVACIVLVMGFGFFTDYLSSANWVGTNGVIVRSEVTRFRDPSSELADYNFRVDVVYQYQTPQGRFSHNRVSSNDGLCILGSCQSFTRIFSYETNAQNYARRYPPGQSVWVLYDPQNPQNAVLSRDVPVLGVATMGGGLAMLVFFGAFFLDRGWRYLSIFRASR